MPDSEPILHFKKDDVDCTITAILSELRHTRQTLKRIEAQTTKTNGRVTALEMENQTSRTKIYTAVAVLTLIGGLAQWFISTGLHKIIP